MMPPFCAVGMTLATSGTGVSTVVGFVLAG